MSGVFVARSVRSYTHCLSCLYYPQYQVYILGKSTLSELPFLPVNTHCLLSEIRVYLQALLWFLFSDKRWCVLTEEKEIHCIDLPKITMSTIDSNEITFICISMTCSYTTTSTLSQLRIFLPVFQNTLIVTHITLKILGW